MDKHADWSQSNYLNLHPIVLTEMTDLNYLSLVESEAEADCRLQSNSKRSLIGHWEQRRCWRGQRPR